MPETTPTPVNCPRCSSIVCHRRGDTLLHAGLEILAKRSLELRCRGCGELMKFKVHRDKEKI